MSPVPWRRRRRERDLDDELAHHIRLDVAERVARGEDPVAAERAARLELGNRTQVRETTRRMWRFAALDRIAADLRFVLRSLRRVPGYAAAVVVLLTLGIGSAVAVVSVVDRVLLRPPPFPEPDRLFSLFELSSDGRFRLASYPTMRDWVDESDVFERLAYVNGNQLPLHRTEGTELVLMAYPTGEFFPLLGVQPLLGRALQPEDDRLGHRVVVLSHRFWQSRFGGDPEIVGTELSLGEASATVVGVMPRTFRLPEWAEAWMPFGAMAAEDRAVVEKRNNHADSRVLGRLRPGLTERQAEEALSAVNAHLAEVHPADQRDWQRVDLVPLDQYLNMMTSRSQIDDRVPRLVLLLIGTVLVLLVSAANVATLALARGYARGQEVALRAALGASRGRLARELLLETGLLCAVGSGLGIALAMRVVAAIQGANPDLLPRLFEVELDGRLIAVAAAIALLTTLGAGLWPAVQTTAAPPFEVLNDGSARAGEARGRRRAQRALVLTQVAVATALLVGAGVLLRSFQRVVDRPLGFEPEGLASIVIQPPAEQFPTEQATLALYQRVEQAVAALPGVSSVALSGGPLNSAVTIPGREPIEGRPDVAVFRTIGPGYFSVMGIPIVQGEGFTTDDLTAEPNGRLLVNEAFVRAYWPGQQAIGQSLSIAKAARWLPDLGQPISGTVIGIVGDVRDSETEANPEVYLPYTWNLWRWMLLQVRARGDVEALRDPVRRALLEVEPSLPVAGGRLGLRTYREQLADSRAGRRLTTAMVSGLSGLALVLTALGLYAVVAYAVTRRRREIGIRLALGSDRRRVFWIVLREGLGVTALGLSLGLIAGWLGIGLLRGLVFGIPPRDPVVFGLVPAVLGLVALLAVAIPASRAIAVPPGEALRS